MKIVQFLMFLLGYALRVIDEIKFNREELKAFDACSDSKPLRRDLISCFISIDSALYLVENCTTYLQLTNFLLALRNQTSTQKEPSNKGLSSIAYGLYLK
jgi:hypothetical protein